MKKKQADTSEPLCVDLVTVDGELITLQIPEDHFDAAMEYLHESIRRGDRWSVERFAGCSAEYRGMSLSSVNCAIVAGTL